MQGRWIAGAALMGMSAILHAQATLEVRTDQTCNLVVNGSPQGQLSPGVPMSLQVGAGAQWIECSTAAGKVRRELNVAAGGAVVASLRASLIGRFESQVDGTVMDRTTGLQWTQADNGGDISWTQSEQYCRELRTADGGWRLPTVAELEQIYDPSGTLSTPCEDTRCGVDAAFRLSGTWFWSSDLSEKDQTLAWYLAFHEAGRGSASLSAEATGRVLCVRQQPSR